MTNHRASNDQQLIDALALSQQLGMLGARPISEVIAQSLAFVQALEGTTSDSGMVVDVGSGGGVPGLVIGWLRPDLELILVERRATRADHLRRMVLRLRLDATVLTADLRELMPAYRQRCAAIVARGLGAPASWMTAAVPLLTTSGRIVVTEPPGDLSRDDEQRWPSTLLAQAGLQRIDQPDERVAVLARST